MDLALYDFNNRKVAMELAIAYNASRDTHLKASAVETLISDADAILKFLTVQKESKDLQGDTQGVDYSKLSIKALKAIVDSRPDAPAQQQPASE